LNRVLNLAAYAAIQSAIKQSHCLFSISEADASARSSLYFASCSGCACPQIKHALACFCANPILGGHKRMPTRDYPYKNLVFEGGGVKGVAHGGVFEVLEQRQITPQIEPTLISGGNFRRAPSLRP
jgi:hypothetical protein